MSLRDKAIKGFSWNFIQQIGNGGVQFIVQIILSRVLSPEEFGLYGILYFFYIISNVISDSGMGQSIIRSNDLDDKDYGTIFVSNLMISFGLYLFIMLLSPFVSWVFDEPDIPKLLAVLCLSILCTSFSTIQMYRLSRLLDFKRQALIQIPSVFIAGIIGLYMAYNDYGIWSLVVMTLSRELLLSLQYWFLTGWRPKFIFDKERFKYHFDFGYKLSISTLLNNLTNNFLPLVIGLYQTKLFVGYYTRANDLVNFPMSTLTTVLGKVSYPVLSQVKDDAVQIKRTFKKIKAVAVYIMGAMMFLFILLAEPIILLLLGDKWASSIPFFQLLCLAGILYPINTYNQNVLKVFGKSDEILKANIITKLVFLVTIFVVARFGIIHMILCIIAVNIFSFFVNVYFSSKYINYSFIEQLKAVIKSLLPSILSFVILYFTEGYIDLGMIPKLFILALLYGIGFVCFSIVTKNSAFSELKGIVLRQIKK